MFWKDPFSSWYIINSVRNVVTFQLCKLKYGQYQLWIINLFFLVKNCVTPRKLLLLLGDQMKTKHCQVLPVGCNPPYFLKVDVVENSHSVFYFSSYEDCCRSTQTKRCEPIFSRQWKSKLPLKVLMIRKFQIFVCRHQRK